MSEKQGWIGVDLDGTLAEYETFKGHDHIGDPIMPMIERVKRWLSEGREVRIFTARADGGIAAQEAGNPAGKEFEDREKIIKVIQDWTEKHIGVRLPVTNVKDYCMDELWDDRAVQVEKNTGKMIGYSPRGLDKSSDPVSPFETCWICGRALPHFGNTKQTYHPLSIEELKIVFQEEECVPCVVLPNGQIITDGMERPDLEQFKVQS